MAATDESPAQRVARQLRALMERHHVKNANEYERMMRDSKYADMIYAVSIRRILNAEAATEPERSTLRKLATFLGESLTQAFPEPDEEGTPVVEVEGRRIALKALDGKPLSPSLAARVKDLLEEHTVEKAERIHKAKKEHRKHS